MRFDDHIPAATTVLVAVINRVKDLQYAREHGWYRVPLAHAPRGLTAELLGFYQTAVFGSERWQVRYMAAIHDVQLLHRRELLPDEPDHQRADQLYYRLSLGPVWRLPLPVTARKVRRVTFIATTYGQLIHAHDLTDLWHAERSHDQLAEVWGAGIGRRSING